jgi:hypothetical protein
MLPLMVLALPFGVIAGESLWCLGRPGMASCWPRKRLLGLLQGLWHVSKWVAEGLPLYYEDSPTK